MKDSPQTSTQGVFKFDCDHCGREVVTAPNGSGKCGNCDRQYQIVLPERRATA